MNRRTIVLFLMSVLLYSAPTYAEDNPYAPFEVVPYVPATGVDATVRAMVIYERESGAFEYLYELHSAETSTQKVFSFEVLALPDVTDEHPVGWGWSGSQPPIYPDGIRTVSWGPMIEDDFLDPGTTTEMTFRSEGVPHITMTYTRGDVPPPHGGQVIDPTVKRPMWPDDSVKIPAVGPEHRPPLPLDGVAFAERLLGLAAEAQELEWIAEANSHALLQTELQQIRQQLDENQMNQARETIEALLLSLDDHRGSGLDDSAYYLFKANLEFFLHHLDTEPGPPISLNLTLHSQHVMPHRNQRVELEVTPSGPANLVFTLYRVANRNLPNELGEPVYSQTATGVTSSYTFTWEGQTTTGEPAHNGNYELVVAAGGVSQSVSVQVNRQQGKQSWLKVGTQTLANLGRPTLMGSLGYAFLPGVTWLATVDEPVVGEKVALGG